MRGAGLMAADISALNPRQAQKYGKASLFIDAKPAALPNILS